MYLITPSEGDEISPGIMLLLANEEDDLGVLDHLLIERGNGP